MKPAIENVIKYIKKYETEPSKELDKVIHDLLVLDAEFTLLFSMLGDKLPKLDEAIQHDS